MFKRKITLPKGSLYDKTEEYLNKFIDTFKNILQIIEEMPEDVQIWDDEAYEKSREGQRQHCKRMYEEIINTRVSITFMRRYWPEGKPILDKMDEWIGYVEKQTDVFIDLDQLLDKGDPFDRKITKKREKLFSTNRKVSLQAELTWREWMAMLQEVWV